jgi:quinol monooxygenase YgiN
VSHGLDALRSDIKQILTDYFELGMGAMRFAEIRYSLIVRRGGDPTKGAKLSAMQQHLLELALKALVSRGDVIVVESHEEPDDPRRYVTVECFASVTGERIRNTAHAKQIVAKLPRMVANEAVAKVQVGGGIYSRIGAAAKVLLPRAGNLPLASRKGALQSAAAPSSQPRKTHQRPSAEGCGKDNPREGA